MKKLAIILSLVLVMGLGAAAAFAGDVGTKNFGKGTIFGPTGEQMAEEYRNGISVAPSRAKHVSYFGTTEDSMAREYAEGTPVNKVVNFSGHPADTNGPITDEEWHRAYYGDDATGSAQ